MLEASAKDQFADGIVFTDLAPVRDREQVVAAMTRALGIQEMAAQSPFDVLKAHLCKRQLLLLLDNFEQIAAAAPLISELMAAAPRLKVLVTSRIVLNVRGEHAFPVQPLALPDPRNLHRVVDQSDIVQAARL